MSAPIHNGSVVATNVPVTAVVADSIAPSMKTRSSLPSYRAVICFHWFTGSVVVLVTVLVVPLNRTSNWSVPVAVIQSRYPLEASDFLTRYPLPAEERLTQPVMVSLSTARSKASLSGTLTRSSTPSNRRPHPKLQVRVLAASPLPSVPFPSSKCQCATAVCFRQ